MRNSKILISTFIILISLSLSLLAQQKQDLAFAEAVKNGVLVNEGFNRSIKYVNAWTKYADPGTGLIPRNIKESKDYWNAWDAAADNYPYMVLTSSILMPEYLNTTALNMLETEQKLTSRIGKLPDTYSFTKKGFLNETPDSSQILFGAAEYMKDGLIPLTEWLGQSPWSDRMLGILNDLPKLTRVVKEVKDARFGKSAVVEVNGDLLQVLTRMYWFTGKREYLDWAVEIGDYYLNDERLPTKAMDRLRIRDHGCEIISGLCEVYLATYYSMPEKRNQWQKYIHQMLDRMLAIGRNADGLFYDEVNPITGEILSERLADNFGYTFNAYYFVHQIDSKPAYQEALIKALSALNGKYRNHDWEGNADGYADAIEGTLNLYNRVPIPSVKEWLDSEIRVLWAFQKPEGIIEGWHGDGNFARTTLMYCLWKTQGIVPAPWAEQLNIGAVDDNGKLKIAITCKTGWEGLLKFDLPRYKDLMHYPTDYPRINQFQQWFTIDASKKYKVKTANLKPKTVDGVELIKGLPVKVAPGEAVYLTVSKGKDLILEGRRKNRR
jgi:hypothetical protein